MTRVVLMLALCLGGCAGSLEQSKAAGANDRKFGLASAGAGTAERCRGLDERRSWFGGSAKALALLAGGSGLSTLPLDDPDQKNLRVGVAAAGVVAAAAAAGAVYVSEAAGDSFARECL